LLREGHDNPPPAEKQAAAVLPFVALASRENTNREEARLFRVARYVAHRCAVPVDVSTLLLKRGLSGTEQDERNEGEYEIVRDVNCKASNNPIYRRLRYTRRLAFYEIVCDGFLIIFIFIFFFLVGYRM
jgi:hypothetical protein